MNQYKNIAPKTFHTTLAILHTSHIRNKLYYAFCRYFCNTIYFALINCLNPLVFIMKNKTIIITMLAAIMAAGCKDKKDLPENYRDDKFMAMLNDSTCMHEEYIIQHQEAVSYTADFYANMEQPVVWNEGGDATLRMMTDWYNACMVINAITTDMDTWKRYSEEVSDLEKDMMDSWRKITFTGISDTMAKRHLKEAIEVYTENTGQDEKRNVGDVAERLTMWMDDIDEDSFKSCIEQHINPRSYYEPIMTVPYDSLVGGNAKPSYKMKKELYRNYMSHKDYDTRMALLFMLMYAYYFDNSNTAETLLQHAEEAFTSGNYSPMLPLVWRAYRVLYIQMYSCPSTYCDIPNVRFNYYRRLIAYTYLKHIERHPDDKDAKIQFYFLAYRENINRFGSYMMGNQSAAEYISLFWNGSII